MLNCSEWLANEKLLVSLVVLRCVAFTLSIQSAWVQLLAELGNLISGLHETDNSFISLHTHLRAIEYS